MPKQTVTLNLEENEMTMKEAITKGYEYVKGISKDAKLAIITSADVKNKQTVNSGDSGKRLNWNLSFLDPTSTDINKDGTTTFYYVQISDGKILDCETQKSPFDKNKTIISDSNLPIDSSEAVVIAKNQKALEPGKDWALGYHFQMSFISSNEQRTDPVITVVGLSPNGNFANVSIDEKTGQIVRSIEIVSRDENGKPTWKNF